jgi:hypothetical protein
MPTKKNSQSKRTETSPLREVGTTIPPHVANVLMRELGTDTPQSAVDEVLAIYTEKPPTKRKGKP